MKPGPQSFRSRRLCSWSLEGLYETGQSNVAPFRCRTTTERRNHCASSGHQPGQGRQWDWGRESPAHPPAPRSGSFPLPFCGMLGNLLSGCILGEQRVTGHCSGAPALTWPTRNLPHAAFNSPLQRDSARLPHRRRRVFLVLNPPRGERQVINSSGKGLFLFFPHVYRYLYLYASI